MEPHGVPRTGTGSQSRCSVLSVTDIIGTGNDELVFLIAGCSRELSPQVGIGNSLGKLLTVAGNLCQRTEGAPVTRAA